MKICIESMEPPIDGCLYVTSLNNAIDAEKYRYNEKTEKEIKEDIPSNYIEINLVSNGRIKDTPTKLHFRCYSASDALDLNVDDDEKTKAIVKVLTRLNYEHFDIGELTAYNKATNIAKKIDLYFIFYIFHFIPSK